MVSPQTLSRREQSPWHASPLVVLPSSQASSVSVAGRQSMRPLPHASVLHVDEQPSHETVLPSSHSSPSSMSPSPHEGGGRPPQGVSVSFWWIVGAAGLNEAPPVTGGVVRYSSLIGLPALSAPASVIWPPA